MSGVRNDIVPVPGGFGAVQDAQAEHIYLESQEGELPDREARTVSSRHELRDRFHRSSTELTLFKEGFLALHEVRGGRPTKRQRFDLLFLDPSPSVYRHVPRRTLKIALALALGMALALLAAAALPSMRAAALGWAAAFSACAITVLAIAAYRTREEAVFFTANGRAPALRLRAGFGCLRAARALLPTIAEGIARARSAASPDKATRLRQEMREHYRLQEAGVISRETCSESTGRLLALFD